MWIFTRKGFISAVANRNEPGTVVARARRVQHLEAVFPGRRILHTPQFDYQYRTVVTVREFVEAIAVQAEDVRHYHNFKDAVKEQEGAGPFYRLCNRIWSLAYYYLAEMERGTLWEHD